jgi:uncharacterized membrane protein YhdT
MSENETSLAKQVRLFFKQMPWSVVAFVLAMWISAYVLVNLVEHTGSDGFQALSSSCVLKSVLFVILSVFVVSFIAMIVCVYKHLRTSDQDTL